MTEPQLGAGVLDEVSCSTLTGTDAQAFFFFFYIHTTCAQALKKSSSSSLKRRRTAFSYTLHFHEIILTPNRLGQTVKRTPTQVQFISAQSHPLGLIHRNCCLDAPGTSPSFMIQSVAHCTYAQHCAYAQHTEF